MERRDRALELLAERAVAADLPALRGMLGYFDRASLFLTRLEGAGPGLVLVLGNDAERFRIPVAVLVELWAGLRAGRAVDWSALEAYRER